MTTNTVIAPEEIQAVATPIKVLRQEIARVVVGQDEMIEGLLIGMLTGGHVLLEGVPGLAKTLTVSTLARLIHGTFKRVQFTPDLLPADLVGTLIYNPRDATFTPRKGPVFANIVLADEINRAPAKVQSALLEAMQERQVTIGDETYPLPDPFLVLATQNPIEQEGTYPLPEAQVDRFMLKLRVGYPTKAQERQILDRMATTESLPQALLEPVLELPRLVAARGMVARIHLDDKIRDYIVELVHATRRPADYGIDVAAEAVTGTQRSATLRASNGKMEDRQRGGTRNGSARTGSAVKEPEATKLIEYGASPRATISLALAARAHALLEGRGYVTPHDVKSVGMEVLRHRVILSYEAEAQEITADRVVRAILDHLPVP